jgi:3-mercaptopyruvate sulfurtransferase SseA/uncharacterized membrane protein YedE/YeeE
MINTLFGSNNLDTAWAFLASLAIGLAFGFFLERAGFGSSRKLASVFYFKDMTVIKVMFTAVLTALIGLFSLRALGLIHLDQVYLLETNYVPQIAGGLIFGIGFVIGGWCPGTAAAGITSGKIDALVFMLGAVAGSALFNELFRWVKPFYEMGGRGVLFVFDSLGISVSVFVLMFCLIGLIMFWLCEYIELRLSQTGIYWNTLFLKSFSLVLLTGAVAFVAVSAGSAPAAGTPMTIDPTSESTLLDSIDQAQDHIEPEELADRILSAEKNLTLVDVRPYSEFAQFNLRGAMNVSLKDLHQSLAPYRNVGTIVLYSNGMTHPAQARDSLYRLGYRNVYLLTDGLDGFIQRCLTPTSLRSEPLSQSMAAKVAAWRAYFLSPPSQSTPSAVSPQSILLDTDWLNSNLEKSNIKIIDLRSQPEYNTSHTPGSLAMSPENFRMNRQAVGSMLQPVDMLAKHVSSMGILPSDTVVLVYGEKPHDAALFTLALERLGHTKYGILNGGFTKWLNKKHPVTADLPVVTETDYPSSEAADTFTVDYKAVLQHLQNKSAIILDVRPADYFNGTKSDEARPGHIPGAINRPYTEDLQKLGEAAMFKAVADLEKAYASIIPNKDSRVIVHCRTGHQASQTLFILNKILGYNNVLWYDAGWSQWAALKDLPAETSPTPKP